MLVSKNQIVYHTHYILLSCFHGAWSVCVFKKGGIENCSWHLLWQEDVEKELRLNHVADKRASLGFAKIFWQFLLKTITKLMYINKTICDKSRLRKWLIINKNRHKNPNLLKGRVICVSICQSQYLFVLASIQMYIILSADKGIWFRI